jgi:hypothetical protein
MQTRDSFALALKGFALPDAGVVAPWSDKKLRQLLRGDEVLSRASGFERRCSGVTVGQAGRRRPGDLATQSRDAGFLSAISLSCATLNGIEEL